MIDRIISFIVYFPANLMFHIGEYEFGGLCWKSREDFPWRGSRGRNNFLSKLSESEDVEDMDRFIYWSKEWMLELIHQRFTWMFLTGVLSYFCLLTGVMLVLGGTAIPALGALILSLMWLLSRFLIRRNISKLYFSIQFTRMTIEMLKESR